MPHVTELEARVRAWAVARLSPERFAHTTGVVETATHLAARYDITSVESLRLAGWIHDAAKGLPDDELLRLATAFGYPVRPVERQAPFLLHGAVSALLAQAELGLNDGAIQSAAAYHTTGHPTMSAADKVFFLADVLEPSRTFSWVAQARALAEEGDLDRALLFVLTRLLRRLLKRGMIIDTRTVRLWNQLLLAGVEFVPRASAPDR